jgi:hypothetical protein
MDSRVSLTRNRSALSIAFVVMMGVVACGEKPPRAERPPTGDGWHAFSGSWTASGTRHTLRLGGDHQASIVNVSGSMLLGGERSMGVGFRAEVIGLSDDVQGLVGHAVWTDERGDQVFSTLKGQKVGTANRISGTITGGTGRYAGVAGDYEFQWQYVIEAEEGMIQGRAIGLKGRFRRGDGAGLPRTGEARR